MADMPKAYFQIADFKFSCWPTGVKNRRRWYLGNQLKSPRCFCAMYLNNFTMVFGYYLNNFGYVWRDLANKATFFWPHKYSSNNSLSNSFID